MRAFSEETADAEIKANLLYRLAKRKAWKGKHIDYAHWLDGMGPRLRKRAEAQAKVLIRENLVLVKPAHYGPQVSLNIREHARILALIGESALM